MNTELKFATVAILSATHYVLHILTLQVLATSTNGELLIIISVNVPVVKKKEEEEAEINKTKTAILRKGRRVGAVS